jgi:hypothetical protein
MYVKQKKEAEQRRLMDRRPVSLCVLYFIRTEDTLAF